MPNLRAVDMESLADGASDHSLYISGVQQPYSCQYCGKCFSKSSYLRVHLRVHTGERPFSCKECEKAFADRSSLKRHVRIHSGERPYVCHICGKSFRNSFHLNPHMRVHTGEKPYVCNVCGRSFRNSGCLKKHSLKHNSDMIQCRTHTREQPFGFFDNCSQRRHFFQHNGDIHDTNDMVQETNGETELFSICEDIDESYIKEEINEETDLLGVNEDNGVCNILPETNGGADLCSIDKENGTNDIKQETNGETGLFGAVEDNDVCDTLLETNGETGQFGVVGDNDVCDTLLGTNGETGLRGSVFDVVEDNNVCDTILETNGETGPFGANEDNGACDTLLQSNGETDLFGVDEDDGVCDTLLERSRKTGLFGIALENEASFTKQKTNGETVVFRGGNYANYRKQIALSRVIGENDVSDIKQETDGERDLFHTIACDIKQEINDEIDLFHEEEVANEESDEISIKQETREDTSALDVDAGEVTQEEPRHHPLLLYKKEHAVYPSTQDEGMSCWQENSEKNIVCNTNITSYIRALNGRTKGEDVLPGHDETKEEEMKIRQRTTGCKKSEVSRSPAAVYRTCSVVHKTAVNSMSGISPCQSSASSRHLSRPTLGIQKPFSQKPSLMAHLQDHTRKASFSCKVCGKSLYDRSGLRRHKRIHTGEKPYICHVCGKSFRNSSHVKAHLRTHSKKNPSLPTHNKQAPLSRVRSGIHTRKKYFSCKECGKSLYDGSSLRRHMRIHRGERPYACPICGKSFRNSYHVKSHLRTHTGEKLYACQDCGMTFNHSTSFKKHLRIHSSGKEKSLQIHSRIHNGVSAVEQEANGVMEAVVEGNEENSLNDFIEETDSFHTNHTASDSLNLGERISGIKQERIGDEEGVCDGDNARSMKENVESSDIHEGDNARCIDQDSFNTKSGASDFCHGVNEDDLVVGSIKQEGYQFHIDKESVLDGVEQEGDGYSGMVHIKTENHIYEEVQELSYFQQYSENTACDMNLFSAREERINF